MMENYELTIGKSFASFSDFEHYLASRSLLTGESWKKASGGRTIQQANKGIKDEGRHFKPSFRYAFVYYRCIHEGNFESRVKGHLLKRDRSSQRIGCQAKFKLVAQRDKDALIVTQAITNHNHELIPSDVGHCAEDHTFKDDHELEVATSYKQHHSLPVLKDREVPSKLCQGLDKSCQRRRRTVPVKHSRKEHEVLSEKERRSVASSIWKTLLNSMVACGQNSFDERCKVLQTLNMIWWMGRDVGAISIHDASVHKNILYEFDEADDDDQDVEGGEGADEDGDKDDDDNGQGGGGGEKFQRSDTGEVDNQFPRSGLRTAFQWSKKLRSKGRVKGGGKTSNRVKAEKRKWAGTVTIPASSVDYSSNDGLINESINTSATENVDVKTNTIPSVPEICKLDGDESCVPGENIVTFATSTHVNNNISF